MDHAVGTNDVCLNNCGIIYLNTTIGKTDSKILSQDCLEQQCQFFRYEIETLSRTLYLHPYYLDSSQLQKIQCRLVRVALQIDNLLHPSIDHHLGAEDAGLVGAIERCPLDADAVHCRLNDGILLSMHRPAKLVARAALYILASAADNIAVVEACRRAIVTHGKNSLILHEKGTHLVMQTGGPLRHY